MNDASFELELQDTFLTEAEEMLEDTESAFVVIEANPDDASKVDKIFRLVHTIKGSAHMAGFVDLGHFAHTFETLLGALRDKKLLVTPEVVDILLEGNDRLKEFVQTLRNDRSAHLDATATEERIKTALSGSEEDLQTKSSPSDPQVEPIKAETDEPAPNDSISKGADPSSVPVFLVVDDEPDILLLLEDALRHGGYRVITASNGIDALKIFKTRPVDVIFTDLKMPEMDGLEFVAAVRKVNEFVPIAFISGHSSREHFKDYLKFRVDSFIDKPFGDDEVLSIAQRLLREARLRTSMLALTKLSFQAYVAVEKILSTLSLDESHEADKEDLDRYMTQMREETTNLLTSERQLKQ